MYTQEIICPNCAKVATINVSTSKHKQNPQSAFCGLCSKRIDFDVDPDGEIMDIRGLIKEPRGGYGKDREPRW